MRTVCLACAVVLGGMLVAVGTGKMLTGWKEGYWVPPWLYYWLAGGEAMVGLALVSRKWRGVLANGIAWMAGLGLLASVVTRGQGRCGCLGEVVELGYGGRLVLLGAIGTLALAVMWTAPCAAGKTTRGGGRETARSWRGAVGGQRRGQEGTQGRHRLGGAVQGAEILPDRECG